jgi:hypothetical protein
MRVINVRNRQIAFDIVGWHYSELRCSFHHVVLLRFVVSCSLTQAVEPHLTGPALKNGHGDLYRESAHIQLTSHVFPPSDEKDCSIRDDLGEMLSQT